MDKIFFAYPSNPPEIGETIERAIAKVNLPEGKVLPWRAMSINGKFIEQEILEQIRERVFVADLTILNFNVLYELGYAIGTGQRILLFRNAMIPETSPNLRELGLLDTIGVIQYNNAQDLAEFLRIQKPGVISVGSQGLNNTAPVYVLNPPYKTDFTIRTFARIKKSGLGLRSFDPFETTRLSALDAIREVAQSRAVLLLMSVQGRSWKTHNLRSAFVAGLAEGMGKVRLILQYGNDLPPIDVRDFVHISSNVDEIDDFIEDFALEVVEALQSAENKAPNKQANKLDKVDLGASAAENEMRTLKNYYLETDAFRKTRNGEVQLVVGRKGSGKTAIFIQIRDSERVKVDNVVLDLMPEGYQLLKFKERVLDFLEEGTMHHTITAFWEYILLLEVTHKVLEVDRKRNYTNERLRKPYQELEQLYQQERDTSEGDFSERMESLIKSISEKFNSQYGTGKDIRLSAPQVTNLIYATDLKRLRECLIDYLVNKKQIWLLFDNVDKGWNATGITSQDVVIIRALIEAAKKLQKACEKRDVNLKPVIFLRNDVYDMLVRKSSDRQKEAKVLLDWTDPDLLREVISLRIQTNPDIDYSPDFPSMWRQICTPFYRGEDSFNYLMERSLMRPRFLINLITHCRSFAVNLHHEKITESDLEKGLDQHSHDLLNDIAWEIQDIFPAATGILNLFLSSKSRLSIGEVRELLNSKIKNVDHVSKVIELLLWYGFLGVEHGEEMMYIYSLNYDIQTLNGLLEKKGEDAVLTINPAFWHALLIER